METESRLKKRDGDRWGLSVMTTISKWGSLNKNKKDDEIWYKKRYDGLI